MFDVFDQKLALKSKKWTREMAIDLASSMDPFIAPLGYGVMLGGSVLSKGSSTKNLNLFFMPRFEPTAKVADDMGLITWLGSILGKSTKGFEGKTNSTYKHYMEFNFDGLPVQVRIGR
jgi:hypothetical protein